MKDFAFALFGFAGLVSAIALLIFAFNLYQSRRDCYYKANHDQSLRITLTGGCLIYGGDYERNTM